MITRVKVENYKGFGEKIVEWTLHPEARPTTMAAFHDATKHLLIIPDHVKSVQFIESYLETLLIKLPNKEQTLEALEVFGKNDDAEYFIPNFYYDKVCEDGAGMSNTDFLYSRIGDYVIAQCM